MLKHFRISFLVLLLNNIDTFSNFQIDTLIYAIHYQNTVSKSNFPIDYDSKIMLLGSCFAENMGEKFEYFKFQATTNPFGIIFNPVSLAKLIERCVQKNYFTEHDIFFHNELWHCYEVHSELSNSDKDAF